ncbi:sodium/proton antiporter (NhaA family) [Thermosporothrix hazakensis]|jgi:NhaA family Na+:H+ antiporter|uniref:Na(+)/H(+) antiporter NhaA n=1 Tax=Thermosporothrix hazakensis TaxID=644383 RepID=A0A326U3L1_THEHA|nr:Na+/H+ antiporter NhaA [Thermosporothrix hazakensis]PZW26685.1 sodium/proton antiporter (NhaA family) [Thermosporothrix hazakensis]
MNIQEQVRKPAQNRIARLLLRPFQAFFDAEVTGGVILLCCTALALIWVNSPFGPLYDALWQTHVMLGIGPFALDEALHFWINDGLMTLFFFQVGLEIKREVLVGELSSLRKSALPVIAALGGMIFPALIFLVFNFNTSAHSGWGISMATDIAFALGALALLGSRIPVGLKVFLAAFAIADDLGAVLVIALFYNTGIDLLALGLAALFLMSLITANMLGIRWRFVYLGLGVCLWLALLRSGIHATLSGVLLAMTIPARAFIDGHDFVRTGRELLDEFESCDPGQVGLAMSDEQQAATQALEVVCEKIQAPLQRLERGLHPWVNFLIMPLFALSNAGIHLEGNVLSNIVSPVCLGVVLGLVCGKQIGITLFSWLVVKLGVSELPERVSWRHIYGASWLGGIGFTMSLFVSDLAFGAGQEVHIAEAKLGILIAALLSGAVGCAILFGCRKEAAEW